MPTTGKKCQHQILRSPRHPIADLACGAPARFRVLSGVDLDCCGTHANFWKRRGRVIIPIITITNEPQICTACKGPIDEDGECRCEGEG
jgi:hypothetical protein